MKIKPTSTLLLFLICTLKILAQTPDSTTAKYYVEPFAPEKSFRTWSFGVNTGLLTTYTLFESKYDDFTSRHELPGYGLFVKKQLLPAFALQADFMEGKLKGSAPTHNADGTGPTGFETALHLSGSISGVLTLANVNWRHNHLFMQPYAMLGTGFLLYSPTLYNSDGTSTTFRPTYAVNFTEKYFTMGAGLKFMISSFINLDLGYKAFLVNADNLDGRDFGASNDKFSYGYVGLEFAIGKRSKPQMASYNPVSSMRHEYLSKVQSLRADVNAEKNLNSKLQSTIEGLSASLTTFGIDSDGDGVPDHFDKCPGTPPGTPVTGAGCPLPVAEDSRLVKDAISDLEFKLGKTDILPSSYPGLNKIAALLISKNFTLKLAGHTDNTGSAAFNMRLSKGRAEAIKNYLVTQGVNPTRIEATGYGQEQPITNNKTEADRKRNRRVEFTLY